MKKNTIIITPAINGSFIRDEDGDILQTPNIDAIYNDIIEGEVYDHIFYINDIEELLDYECFNEVCYLLYDMMQVYFDDYNNIDGAVIEIINTDTFDLMATIIAKEVDDDVEFSIYSPNDDDDESECDGDCEHCELHEHESNDECDDDIHHATIDTFFFGFGW